MEQLTTEGVNPMPTRLIEQVTMLTYVASEAASWNSWAENMVDPAISMGSCSSANSGEMPVTTLGRLFPCRDHAISANPGGGVHQQLMVSSCCGSTFWVGAADGLATWAVDVGFDCNTLPQTILWPKPYGSCCGFVPKKLQEPMGSNVLEDMILTQLEGGELSRTSTLVNVVRGSMAHQSSSTFSASC